MIQICHKDEIEERHERKKKENWGKNMKEIRDMKKKKKDSFLPLHLFDSSDLEQPHKFYIKDHGRHGEERANRFHYQNLEGNNFRTKQITLLDSLFGRIWLCRTVSLYSLSLHWSQQLIHYLTYHTYSKTASHVPTATIPPLTFIVYHTTLAR